MNSEFSKETIRKIKKLKSKLERKLNIKIKIENGFVEILGEEFNIYIAEKVFQALERNFPVNVVLLLTEQDYVLEDIQIKSLTRKNPKQVKARIIGTEGRTLKLISELSDCHITLHENTVSIIGQAEKIKDAINAIRSLILGSKQSNVYKYLERQRKKSFPEDLGLKTKI